MKKPQLISFYNEIKKTIQDYVTEISRHCRYKTLVAQMPEGCVLDDRSRLIDLYDTCLTQDAHLRACMETLYSYLTGDRYMLCIHSDDGKWICDEEASKKIQGLEFEKIIHGILDACFYGYTLLYIDARPREDTLLLNEVTIMERRNVLPAQHRVIKRQGQWNPGWNLDSMQMRHSYVLVDSGDLGIYATTTPLVLAKKYTVANWVNFAHTYGQPIIHGRTGGEDHESRMRLAESIVNAAQNRVVITGKDDEVDIKTFNTAISEKLYYTLIEDYANKEMSNLILGSSSMAGEQQSYVGSTRVHENIFRERIKKYRIYVENVMNEQILPLFRYWNYIPENLMFKYSNNVDIPTEDKLKLFELILQHYDIDKNVLEKEFGIRLN